MLLEREPELTVMRKAVLEVESGGGALLLIDGEAGAGTTALLRELVRLGEDAGARVLRSGGAQSERPFPLGVVRQLVLPLLAAPDHLVPAASRAMLGVVSGAVGRNPGDELGTDALASVLHGLHTALTGLSAGRTVVVVVDDLHWVDEASLRALAFLAARLDGMRVLIGVVLQDGERSRDPLVREITDAATYRLRTEALSEEATARLMVDRFGAGSDSEFAAACHDLTSGSPKELRVLLDRAQAQRLRGRAAEVERVRELGGSFRRERLLRLLRRDWVVHTFAKALVVLADQATEDLVVRLSGLSRDECAAARSVLWKARLLSGSGRLAVHDPVLTRAITESLGAEESSRLHRAAVALLDEYGAGPEEIAVQLLHVDTVRDRWEVDQLRAAAVAARRRGAPDAAVRYLRRALLDLPIDGRERADLLVELAAVEWDTDPASAVRHSEQAARLMPDHRRRAEVVSRTPLHMAGCDQRLADLVREVSARFDDPGVLRGYDRELALRLEARSRYAAIQDPEALASAGDRLAELGGDAALGSGAERELCVVLMRAVTLNGQVGTRNIVRMAQQVLGHEPTHSAPMSAALQILPWMLLVADAGDVASSWLDAALAHAQRQTKPALAALIEAQRGLVLLGRGDVVVARECALRGLELADRDKPETMLVPAVAVGQLALELQDNTLAERVLEIAGSDTDLRMFLMRRCLRGRLAAARGDLPAALAQFLDCGRVLDRVGWVGSAVSMWQVSAALLHRRLGRPKEAIELAEENHRRALAWGAPTALGRALHTWGAVTDGPKGIELLRQAVDVLHDAGSPLELSRTLVTLGKRLQSAAPAEGDQLLIRGRRLAEQSQTFRVGEHTGGLVRGVTPTPAPVARSVLTRGEATVAELAARGRSNQEIAAELEISRRAVEKHLTNSYRKLGIEGRSALVAALGVHSHGE